MKRVLLLALLVALAGLGWWAYQRRNAPPTVPFAKAQRETLTSTLATNGKVEPSDWQSVRAELAGVVDRAPAVEGAQVRAGDTLAVLGASGLQAELRTAEARIAEARAQLARLKRGGSATELAEIQNSLERARNEREIAQRERESLGRLAAKQAATGAEVDVAQARARAAELEIAALERRREALRAGGDAASAQARLREAEAAAEAVKARMADTVIRSPIAGTVYQLAARRGVYLNIGDLVANVGRLDTVRVRVYVDEPELGRVAAGQPVTITWDALPGATWRGAVERKPVAIQELGTRQVGEVLCTIENQQRQLLPGANVNAEIQTSVIPDALTVPKEAVRRDARGSGVYTLQGATVAWRSLALGASSVTRVQITAGLKEGDSVALGAETALQPGQPVTPVYP